MQEPFIGQIALVPYDWAPVGWMKCEGQVLPINQNQALYSLLGTTYGGNGQTTFALPDFRGRAPVHTSSAITLGQQGGQETVVLTTANLPQHSHAVVTPPAVKTSANAGDSGNPASTYFATVTGTDESGVSLTVHSYSPGTPATAMSATTIQGVTDSAGGNSAGGVTGHENMQPYLVMNYIIATEGIYPG